MPNDVNSATAWAAEEEHNCEVCSSRHSCALPQAFSLVRTWDKAQMLADPFLAPFLANGPEVNARRQAVSGPFEDFTDENGNRCLVFIGSESVVLAIRQDADGRWTNFDDDSLPRVPENEDGVFFGDYRPQQARRHVLHSFTVDGCPDGNRLIVAIQTTADGLLLSDDYMMAMIGWQAYPEALPEVEGAALADLLKMLGG